MLYWNHFGVVSNISKFQGEVKMKGEYLAALLALCVASPSVMAGDYKPAFELNTKQMDDVTAGVDASAGAFAFAAGLLNASNAQTAAFAANAGDEGTFIVSVGGAQAAGDNTGTGAAAATDSGGLPSFTYSFSVDHQGNSLSHSGAVEITFIPSFID